MNIRPLILSVAVAATSAGFALSAAAQPEDVHKALALLRTSEGNYAGIVIIDEPVKGQGVIVDTLIMNLPVGPHALHIHETGECEAPDFESAGGHFAPDGKKHGIRNPDGMHAGDLPNIHIPVSRELRVENFNPRLSLDDRLFDEDGAAVVIHANSDDYISEPAGDAGPRIACGVIEPL